MATGQAFQPEGTNLQNEVGNLSTKLNYRQLNLERMKTRMHSCAPSKSANNNTYLLALVPFIVMFWPLKGAIWPFLKYYNLSQNSDQILESQDSVNSLSKLHTPALSNLNLSGCGFVNDSTIDIYFVLAFAFL